MDRAILPKVDLDDYDSVLRYSACLYGYSVKDIYKGQWDLATTVFDDDGRITHSKGRLGNEVESLLFGVPANSIPKADMQFPDGRHIELKTTRLKDDGTPKERLVLGMIDYMSYKGEADFEGRFLEKNGDILLIFFPYRRNVPDLELPVTNVKHWVYSEIDPNDARMIREDWEKLKAMVLAGKAHELSERLFKMLSPCRKGQGNGKDDVPQPFSDTIAQRRAWSFKVSYLRKILEEYAELKDSLPRHEDLSGSIFPRGWTGDFENSVLDLFSRYKGMSCSEIEKKLGVSLNPASKQYYADLVRRILGIHTKGVKEFEDAGISFKIIRLGKNGRPKESMSFPYIRYDELPATDWEHSDVHGWAETPFFSPVFQMTDAENNDKGKAVLLGGMFWCLPYEDLLQAEEEWNLAKRRILSGTYEHILPMSETRVIHVRPHARDSDDTCLGVDGKPHTKMSFWLNASYIQRILRSKDSYCIVSNLPLEKLSRRGEVPPIVR